MRSRVLLMLVAVAALAAAQTPLRVLDDLAPLAARVNASSDRVQFLAILSPT